MRTLTIAEWCERHQISRPYFYSLMKAGKAPRTFNIGRSVRITEDADREWRLAREAEASTSTKQEAAAA